MTELTAQYQLVSAIMANDESVLKQLYQNNYRKVEAYILKNRGSMPQAKDIYQEAFLAVWQNIKKGAFQPRNESALQGYLFQIAKNKWTDELRSARYKKTQRQESFQNLEDHPNEIDQETRGESLHACMRAFGELGDECKELLTRFYFNRDSLRDIASFFSIEETSARNKKYRCIQQLKALVNPSL
ncbi:MAG TPA: sigma-70 family RNA polymerase sigma factor [Flavobacteriaceae bacterium]|nr:sigma-70 family RNA polymerase sigma factor [Flavobacteriaceae bacterium]MCB9213887.1 sigma-70 family RNA polymerase sigma factor [Alteromonas sp.]HPF11128.1 sigma-70 family RNA polymerase sigma factor [Flavobacteriaceae bacterium]HQU21204.1 sigma-70 family RNA polymerase sigma factor [Flavobacteriaceae bacterium]HQU65676.1 sigma-70 family RNA polymerase sigma factor [Flavobacteriaceae bacterium]